MDFGQALDELKAGGKVEREGWNGKGMWLELVADGAGFDINAHAGEWIPLDPFIAMRTVQATFVPWLASQTDILATDWRALTGAESA